MEATSARQDSVAAAQLAEIILLQRRVMDSVMATRTALGALKGDLAGELYSIQQQMVQVQELTGQSQRRLTELRTQLEARGEQLETPVPGQVARDTARGPVPAGSPSADQMYEVSLQQLRRGSPGTARLGLRELLRLHPNHPRAADAVYFIGESFSAENPDSATYYYNVVARNYPSSPRAGSALYKMARQQDDRGRTQAAIEGYQRVVQQFPNSDEAALARERLKTLGR